MIFKIVIPSYNRITTLKEKTYKLLQRYNTPLDQIWIFTAPSEYDAYRIAFPESNVIRGELGLRAQRNYITNFFEEGTPLVHLDDDLESIWTLQTDSESEKQTLVELPDLSGFISECFRLCLENRLHFWGIYPISNAFFMKPDYSLNLKFCIGHMWGCINCKDIQITLDYKEDVERSILYYKRDGKILRMNNICAKTKMGKPGGMGKRVKERLDENIKSSEYLIKEYPEYVIKNKKREGEVLIRDLKKKIM